ncbi:hypothetical protein YDYSG_47930 [Paenibacillus tyrfis]|nr:hypothetical protein YDYSG_47930 [Paenibacillus tyrfis]
MESDSFDVEAGRLLGGEEKPNAVLFVFWPIRSFYKVIKKEKHVSALRGGR